MSVRLLEPRFVERMWGTERLAPLFPDQDRRIGEVWFDAGPGFPLLAKFLFTSDRLSVQVHPDDTYARSVENSRGKTEMWHILEAGPAATIALGFHEPIPKETLRAACEDGTVRDLLNWVPVKAGETFFAEAGVVHAIGGGITLCEIQQNSDVTYRLYDYGRRRELHLDKGFDVLKAEPYDGRRQYPVSCDHFETDLLEIDSAVERSSDCGGLLIVLEGKATIGDLAVEPGNVCLLEPGDPAARIAPLGSARLLHARCVTAATQGSA